jgi:tRNA modification GTPase
MVRLCNKVGATLRVLNCLSLPLRPSASLLGRAAVAVHCSAADAGAADAWVSKSFTPSSSVGDTIFALSSGAGRAGVSVVRVSGPQAREVFLRMAPGRNGETPEPRKAVLRKLWAPEDDEGKRGGLIDEVLALWFPAPNSFTGEDTVELHTHGSRAVVAATLEALGRLEGLRMAEPGEFTRQAFANGRMELTQVEGLADLINADTEEQRKQALRNMGGAQRSKLEGWRQELLSALAHTEALIDFGEDADDVTADALRGAVTKVRVLRREVENQLSDGGRGEVVREGVRVAILGPPNAGKSSLLNMLAQRPAAIVSPIAGTTRDVVQVTLQLGGLPVLLSDTAGLRESTDDPIEQQGILRTLGEARRAQVQLWVYDATDPPTRAAQLDTVALGAGAARSAGVDGAADEALGEGAVLGEDASSAVQLLVLNKLDLLHSPGLLHSPAEPTGTSGSAEMGAFPWSPLLARERQYHLSCTTGEGVQPFLDALSQMIASKYGASDREAALITRARHREHLRRCADALEAFEQYAGLGDSAPLDLAAEEIRIAANELGKITGRIDVEELLDVIFRDFCIGK